MQIGLTKAGAPTSGVDEVQRVSLTGGAFEGTFTLTFGEQETAPIPYNATAAEVQAALEALSSIGSRGVVCSGGPLPGTPVVVTFSGNLGGLPQSEMTIDGDEIAGAAPDVTVTTTQTAVAEVAQVETATVVGTIESDGAGDVEVIVTAAGMAGSPKTIPVAVANDDTAADVAGKIRTALAADEDVGDETTGFFTVSGSGADVALTAKAAAANDPTLNISIDNGTCAGLTPAPTSVNTTAGVAGVNEIQQVALTGGPTGGTFTLTFDGQETSNIDFDASAEEVEAALLALSNIDPGEVSCSGGPLPGAPVLVEFTGGLAQTNVAEMTGDGANLTEPGTLIETLTAGVRGDFRGAAPDDLMLDTTNRIIYRNVGTRWAPVWAEIPMI